MKAVIFLCILFGIIVYMFVAVLPGTEINVKNIDKITSEIIRTNQIVVVLLGTIFSSILLDLFEIIEPREKFLMKIVKNAEKEDFPLPLGFGSITVGVALFIQAVTNIAMYFWSGRPSGTSWFVWTSAVILVLSLISIIGGGFLLASGAA